MVDIAEEQTIKKRREGVGRKRKDKTILIKGYSRNNYGL